MKTSIAIATLGLASVLSFGASAANLVTQQQADSQHLQSTGVISVSGNAGSPMTIRQALSDKANKEGASAYRIIEARNDNNFHATAEIYK